MTEQRDRLTRLDRWLGAFTRVRPSEGRSVVAFFVFALLIMASYYVLKTIREPLLLTDSGAEWKSYAYATISLVLLLIVPLYGFLFRRAGRCQYRSGNRRVSLDTGGSGWPRQLSDND